MIDISAARQAYNAKETDNMALIRSEHNLADGQTTIAPNGALNTLIKTHKLPHPAEQYIMEC